ncbi:MAG: hypothetical protein AB7V13_20950 [Pseudorhodoplanes sp.]|jgi:hypothetical protein|uniref:hypothetical protein n=1 Tax=Pseudorhodoplanes sp. TaxID=1934341 RepID=UPI003D148CF0
MTRYRSIALSAGLLFSAVQAAGQNSAPVKIVGIGATSCARFTTEIAANSDAERNYLAWMQGYMSGIMVGRPAGVDEGIDLAPNAFPLAAQAVFMREFCAKQPKSDFADGVEQLYVRLKKLNGT